MGSKDNLVDRSIAADRATRKSDRRLKTLLRDLLETLSEQLSADQHPSPVADDHDPFEFGEQVVLRLQGQVPVDAFVRIHNLFKTKHATVNELLGTLDPTDELYILNRCAIRALCEEQLKTTAQLSGIYPQDPEMTVTTQELFEQFYEAHGKPNDAEKDLLETVGDVNGDVIDQWFAAKEFRLRAVTVMEREILRWKFKLPGYIAGVKGREIERERVSRSIYHH